MIGTTQYVAEDASMLPKVVVTSDEEDVASPSSSDTSSFVASKRSRREAGRIRVYFCCISFQLLELGFLLLAIIHIKKVNLENGVSKTTFMKKNKACFILSSHWSNSGSIRIVQMLLKWNETN